MLLRYRFPGPLLADGGRSTQHIRWHELKNRGLSRKTGTDPKRKFRRAFGVLARCLPTGLTPNFFKLSRKLVEFAAPAALDRKFLEVRGWPK